LKGSSGARIFRKGLEPVETTPGQRLDHFFVTQSAEAIA